MAHRFRRATIKLERRSVTLTSRKIINSKLKEAVDSVLPITLIVAVLCFFFVPVGSGLMLAFLVGAVMLIIGMGLFTLGAELSMTQMGNLVGAKMTKSRRLWLILVLAFVLGVVITIAEPDLQVLAQNVPGIDKTMLILTVSVGVGIFLTICMLRILLGISLRTLLLVFYAIVFVLAALSDPDFLSVAFDSGGVTTGPMTVPFIMALGVGVASIRSDEKAKSDSFGLVALCSIGPILTVLLAQLFSRSNERLGKYVYIGAVIAIAGVVLVVLNGQLSFHLSPVGDLLALAAALMWAVYSILIKKYTEQYDNFLVTRRVFLWAFLTSLPLVLLTDGLPSLTPLFTQPNILISWLFLGVFGNAVCFAIWNIAFKALGVVVTNNYLYASPFVTVFVGWLLLGEPISVMSIIGAVLITAGVIVAYKEDKPKAE